MDPIDFLNSGTIDSSGWAHLAPYGDFRGRAQRRTSDGTIERFSAIQRIDPVTAAELVNAFSRPAGTAQWATSVPIYRGHPDVPGMEEVYPDKTPLGAVIELQTRPDGIWARPAFTHAGLGLVESRALRAFSARWQAVPDGEEHGQPIYRPAVLLSAGLTNHPNLPVELMNEWLATEATSSAGQSTKPMNRDTIIALLTKQGITFASDASDAQLAELLQSHCSTLANDLATNAAALERLKSDLTARDAALTQSAADLAAARTEFDNERKARIDIELDLATAQGRITAAQRAAWQAKLSADFLNESAFIRHLKPVLKTESVTANLAGRAADVANTAQEPTGTARVAAAIEREINTSK